MEYSGVVIDIKDKKAYLMTDSCEIVCIRKQPGMYPGLKVIFDSSEKIDTKKTTVKFAAVIGSVAAVFIAVLLYSNLFYTNKIYAFVDFDMGTNMELMVDKDNKVLDVKPHDESSKLLLNDLDLKSKPLDIALVEMIDKLDEKGVIDLNAGNKVLITACLSDKASKEFDKDDFKNLEQSYDKITDKLSSRSIEPHFFEAKSDDRKMAVDNNISVSRYLLMKIIKENGIDIDVEKIKNSEIGEILKKVENSQHYKELSEYVPDQKTVQLTGKKNEDNKGKSNKGDNVTNVADVTNTANTDNLANEANADNEVSEVDIDLAVDEINDISSLDDIESSNLKTQKIIKEIQKQVAADIASETEKAKKETDKIKMDWSISIEEKAKRIKEIESNLKARIDEINRIGEEKCQAEINRLNKEADNLLQKRK